MSNPDPASPSPAGEPDEPSPPKPSQPEAAPAGPAPAPRSGRSEGRSEEAVLKRIEAWRRRPNRFTDEVVTLAHGAGGKASDALIGAVFVDAFANKTLAPLADGASLTLPSGDRLAFSTDSFVVKPLRFPGGSIGHLAVHGTVNDLAVMGATPAWLSAGFVIEEGFAVSELRAVVADMAAAARDAGVEIVTGDTKVVQRGKGDGCYINTAGVGLIPEGLNLGVATARPGDMVIVSGPVGDHGITIMLERGELDLQADLVSDTAAVHELVRGLLDAVGPDVRAMRDATRGGVATILNEVATAAGVAVVVEEEKVP
ncbi:MAG: hydrogenase expression/formation protein HypE, partial [Candidatus Dormibacteria bacterium]